MSLAGPQLPGTASPRAEGTITQGRELLLPPWALRPPLSGALAPHPLLNIGQFPEEVSVR